MMPGRKSVYLLLVLLVFGETSHLTERREVFEAAWKDGETGSVACEPSEQLILIRVRYGYQGSHIFDKCSLEDIHGYASDEGRLNRPGYDYMADLNNMGMNNSADNSELNHYSEDSTHEANNNAYHLQIRADQSKTTFQICPADFPIDFVDCGFQECYYLSLSEASSIPGLQFSCNLTNRYWQICYVCIAETLDDFSDYDWLTDYSAAADWLNSDYAYGQNFSAQNLQGFDFSYLDEASNMDDVPIYHTHRYDVDGYDDISCDDENQELTIIGVEFNLEQLTSHSADSDGSSICQMDFTQVFIRHLCHDNRCKSPQLSKLEGMEDVRKNCPEQENKSDYIGSWNIVYECMDSGKTSRQNLSPQFHLDDYNPFVDKPLKSHINVNENSSNFSRTDETNLSIRNTTMKLPAFVDNSIKMSYTVKNLEDSVGEGDFSLQNKEKRTNFSKENNSDKIKALKSFDQKIHISSNDSMVDGERQNNFLNIFDIYDGYDSYSNFTKEGEKADDTHELKIINPLGTSNDSMVDMEYWNDPQDDYEIDLNFTKDSQKDFVTIKLNKDNLTSNDFLVETEKMNDFFKESDLSYYDMKDEHDFKVKENKSVSTTQSNGTNPISTDEDPISAVERNALHPIDIKAQIDQNETGARNETNTTQSEQKKSFSNSELNDSSIFFNKLQLAEMDTITTASPHSKVKLTPSNGLAMNTSEKGMTKISQNMSIVDQLTSVENETNFKDKSFDNRHYQSNKKEDNTQIKARLKDDFTFKDSVFHQKEVSISGEDNMISSNPELNLSASNKVQSHFDFNLNNSTRDKNTKNERKNNNTKSVTSLVANFEEEKTDGTSISLFDDDPDFENKAEISQSKTSSFMLGNLDDEESLGDTKTSEYNATDHSDLIPSAEQNIIENGVIYASHIFYDTERNASSQVENYDYNSYSTQKNEIDVLSSTNIFDDSSSINDSISLLFKDEEGILIDDLHQNTGNESKMNNSLEANDSYLSRELDGMTIISDKESIPLHENNSDHTRDDNISMEDLSSHESMTASDSLEMRVQKETQHEIKNSINALRNDLELLVLVNQNVNNISKAIIKESAKKSISKFFRAISSLLNVFEFHSKQSNEKEVNSELLSSSASTASSVLNATSSISKIVASTLEVGAQMDFQLQDVSMTVLKKAVTSMANTSTGWEASSVHVELPDQDSIIGPDSSVTVSFTSYENIGLMMSQNGAVTGSVLGVDVMGVRKINGTIPLLKPIKFAIKHKTTSMKLPKSCVFWNFLSNQWNREGCYPVLHQSNETSLTCECYHLTNFAILIDVHNLAREPLHEIAQEIITHVGCSLSAVSLFICLIVFTTFRSTRNERSAINFHICLMLLISELVFLIGVSKTDDPTACFAIALMLHYLLLSSFCWMLVGGYQMYLLLIDVFEQDSSRKVQYYMIGYIIPLLGVLSSLLIDTLLNEKSTYGSQDACWISDVSHLVITFIIPIGLILTANFYFLLVASWKVSEHCQFSPQTKSRPGRSISSYIKGMIGLSFFLGITWVIGILAVIIPSDHLTFAFTIVNTLQGVFIFFFNCVLNRKVASEGRRYAVTMVTCLRVRLSVPLVRKESTTSNTSQTTSTDVREYFLPTMQYNVGSRIYPRETVANLAITYYY